MWAQPSEFLISARCQGRNPPAKSALGDVLAAPSRKTGMRVEHTSGSLMVLGCTRPPLLPGVAGFPITAACTRSVGCARFAGFHCEKTRGKKEQGFGVPQRKNPRRSTVWGSTAKPPISRSVERRVRRRERWKKCMSLPVNSGDFSCLLF